MFRLIRNIRMGRRIALMLGLVILALGMACALALYQLKVLSEDLATIRDSDARKARATALVASLVRANAANTMELFLIQDFNQAAVVRARIDENKAAITKELETLSRLISSDAGRKLLADVVSARKSYVESFQRVLKDLAADNQPAALEELRRATLPALGALTERLSKLDDLEYRREVDGITELHDQTLQTSHRVLALMLVTVLGSIALGVALSRTITQPLERAIETADAIAAGELRTQVTADSTDELGALLQSLEAMRTALGGLVKEIRDSSSEIATSAQEIASGANDLSRRTEEQAASLEQSAAAIATLSERAVHGVETARSAVGVSNEAVGQAREGTESIQRADASMRDIAAAGARISDIVGVIDTIAFQTNILALNAAVEAARAGDHGRGFAVVAAEVRALAVRCTAAARDVKQLVEQNRQSVEVGAGTSLESLNAVHGVVQSVDRTKVLLSELEGAMDMQQLGLTEVNTAVTRLDEMTQQNAALVEESAAASISLSEQAVRLTNLVSRFKA